MPKPNFAINVNSGPSPRPVRQFAAGGDLIGTLTRQTVTGLQNVPVSPNSPGFGQVLKYNGEWTPQDESGGGGGNGVDIGAIHPASLKRAVGGLVLPHVPGAYANVAGSVLTATGRSSVRGSFVDTPNFTNTGLWVLSDGVVYQVGHPSDPQIGAIPLYDNDSGAAGSGPEPLTFGGGYAWALTLAGSFGQGELTKIDPNIGAIDYSGNQAGQAVITGRLTGDNFPGLDTFTQIFWSPELSSLIVYCPNGFLDKPGGVFYQVDTNVVAAIPFTLTNTDSLWPGGGFVFTAFKQCSDDGLLYALANFDGSGGFSGTRVVQISLATQTVTDVVDYPGELSVPKLEYSNLFSGVFYWVSEVGTFHKTLRSPFGDTGESVNVTATFSGAGGYWYGLWGVQSGGAYDQTIGIAVGYNSDYDTLVVDLNLFDMTLAGTSIVIQSELDGIQPGINRVQYFPYPEGYWWLFDDNNAKAYRYGGFGTPSPYPRFPFGGQAEWKTPDTDPIPHIIWRPGGASGAGVVSTWREVAAKIEATGGYLKVYIDGRFGTATVTAATPEVNCLGKTQFIGIPPNPPSFELVQQIDLFFDGPGAHILHPFSFENLNLNNSTGDFNMVVTTDFGLGFSLTNCQVYVASATWTVAPIRMSNYHGKVLWVNTIFGSFFPPSSVPIIDATGSSEIELQVERSPGLQPDYWAYMVGGDGVFLTLRNDESVHLPVQPLNVGGTHYIRPLTVPYSGLTADRPNTFRVGDPYFDTTLNRPIWYTGFGWITADGTAV